MSENRTDVRLRSRIWSLLRALVFVCVIIFIWLGMGLCLLLLLVFFRENTRIIDPYENPAQLRKIRARRLRRTA